jgi:hypothetical protein
MDHPRPWLRYVDADDLENSSFDFDGLNVESATGDKLGDVDGFIVDRDSGRPYYVAVNAGGWFKSKLFLLPIGHVAFDEGRKRLVSDVPRDRVERFPGFDRDEFEKLSDDDLRRMDEGIVASCCPSESTVDTSTSRFDSWSHYKAPTWWSATNYRVERTDTAAAGRTATTATSGVAMPSRDDVRRERDRDRDRELVTAQGGDTSPHLGGRAQPGDVLGVETGGESTHIGETSDDENKRRQDAEKDAAKRNRD